MSLQLVFCVETTKKCKSDEMYIRSIFRKCLEETTKSDVKLSFVYMGGKSMYNDSSVIKQIENLKAKYHDTTEVIYVFDTDKMTTSQEDIRFQKLVKNYTIQQGYHYVWFCENIEAVMIPKVKVDNKCKEAENFMRNLTKIDFNLIIPKLNEDTMKSNSSNIMRILNKLLTEK